MDCSAPGFPVHPKGNQSWIFIGRTDAEAETPVLWPPDVKNWLFGKDPDTGKDWRQEEKGTTEDEMVGWHHWLNGHKFKQAPRVAEEQEAWHGAVHGVAKSRTWLGDWTELNFGTLFFWCYCKWNCFCNFLFRLFIVGVQKCNSYLRVNFLQLCWIY